MELVEAGCVHLARPFAANPLVSCSVTFDFRVCFLDLVGILHNLITGNLSKTERCRVKRGGHYIDRPGKSVPSWQRAAGDGWSDNMCGDHIHTHQCGFNAQSICSDIHVVPSNSFLVRECQEEVYWNTPRVGHCWWRRVSRIRESEGSGSWPRGWRKIFFSCTLLSVKKS